MKKTILNVMVILTVIFSTAAIVTGATTATGDESLFVANVPPDALILLDMSGSMVWDPAGIPAVYPNRRIDIARKVLKDLLDDNDDTKIDTTDEDNLNVRLGYMRFWNSYGEDSVVDPYSGSVVVRSEVGSKYSDVWNMIVEAGTDELTAYSPVGGTPLAGSAREAKKYFQDYVNPKDTALECRKKYVILITDGADTWGCNGNGNTTTPQMRMLTVQRVKELREAGIYVFVVGFGSTMPPEQLKTLNWAALYGGTFDPDADFVGDPEAYDISLYLPTDPALSACNSTADPVALDPATYELSGYAFLAADATALSKSLKSILAFIGKKAYSYTSPTAPAVRISEGSVVYLSSFTPNDTPHWEGTFRGYTLNPDGTLPVDTNGYPINPIWDAGEKLKLMNPDSRKIYVNLDGSSTPKLFTKTIVSASALGLTSTSDRDKLVNHIRGFDAYDINFNKNTTEQKPFKLADIVHSNGVIVGEPSRYYEDQGYNGTGNFYVTHKDRKKVIISGANDGMLHAFDATSGNEVWGFIPNSVLKNLKLMRYSHTYYVDSSPRVADVWFYSSSTDTTKSADEWRTVLICGLRKGGNSYFALDITDTENPKLLWEFPSGSSDADKVGESWSEPTIGKVKIEVSGQLYERWVAFIGGGYLKGEHTHNDPDGRSFFVIDIKTGNILWEFYYDDKDAKKQKMTWGLASSPTAVDIDYDGFIDKVYLGDLGGNMWVFNVSFNEATKKSNSLWNGKVLYDGTKNHPIYYQPAVAIDKKGVPWVFWGTGDREDPTGKTSNERFFGVKDDDDDGSSYPYKENNLTNVTTTNTFDPDPLNKGTDNKGWYMSMVSGEKVLSRPAVFSGLVYFTTFTPGETKDCKVAGGPRLYMVEFRSGGGATQFSNAAYLANTTSARYLQIGSGVPSSPVISVDSKGNASVIAGTTGGGVYSRVIYSQGTNKQLLYWREVTP